MKIDPQNLVLTRSAVRELAMNYCTHATFTDYFIDEQVFDRPVDGYLADLLEDSVKGTAYERNERWVREYQGWDSKGFDCVEFRAYKGDNAEYMEPHALHMKLRLRFKRAPWAEEDPGSWGAVFVRGCTFIGKMLVTIMAMCAAEGMFPTRNRWNGFCRDMLVGWGTLRYLDTIDEKNDREAKTRRIERMIAKGLD